LKEEHSVAVRKRIAVSYNLETLDLKETEAYIDHRLKIAGATENLFTPEAIRDIFYFTGGLPRLINIICDHALMIGYSRELKRIDDGLIAECREDLQILSDRKKYTEEEEESFEANQEIIEINESPDEIQVSKKIWLYSSFILAFIIIIGYLIFNFAWRDVSVVELKENIHPLENNGSEKEIPKSEDVNKSDVDNETASKSFL
jgi:hypothetical protein